MFLTSCLCQYVGNNVDNVNNHIIFIQGHVDVVFSLAWLDDTRLISGSRDHQVALWNLSEDLQSFQHWESSSQQDLATWNPQQEDPWLSRLYLPLCGPQLMCKEHRSKVRCLRMNHRQSVAKYQSSNMNLVVLLLLGYCVNDIMLCDDVIHLLFEHR